MAAGLLYLVKTTLWLVLRIPLILPIDRWNTKGSPIDDNSPALIRAITYFPFDFTLFYGALLGLFYTALVLWMVYGPFQMGEAILVPGLMLAGSVCAGAIAIGVPVNLILTAKFSRRLAERELSQFQDVPGKSLSLRAKMATIALALGCAPSLLLFSVQRFVEEQSLYSEAGRTASTMMRGLATERPSQFQRWVLSEKASPFWVKDGEIRFFGNITPSTDMVTGISASTPTGLGLIKIERKSRTVVMMRPSQDGSYYGVLVEVAEPENHWLAMSLVILLACCWPLLTAVLLVRTIVVPVSFVASTFHRIIGRGRTEGSDRVPIFYKDEVGRLAFNANRTIDILTEARQQLEVTAESLAQKNQELEQAYRTKGEFLANMSHELRTPLNAIIGFSRLMKRKLGDTLPERQQRNLGLIEQSGEQLLTLVNDLLDFEKIEAGKLTVRREKVELGPILEGLESTLRPLAQEKGLVLAFDVEKLPETLYSDKERLRQIFSNLVTNALKYSDHGTVSVLGSIEGEEAVLRVRDQGIGMSAEQLQSIFDPFHQLDGTQTRERGGVGLGLAIVRRLTDLLKGQISVQSTLGEGSEFEVRFPIGSPSARLRPQGMGVELLVVDDNADELETIHSDLSDAGFRVLVASSGDEALEQLGKSHPLCLLLDIEMPDMDGWDVLRRLREQGRLEELRVLITSVEVEPPEDFALESFRRLTKPVDPDELGRLLLAERVAGLGGGGLAIVEDDPHTSQLLMQLFSEADVSAQAYATESEAVAAFTLERPAVLILDLKLSRGSGWSVLKMLRSLPGGENVLVLVYSAADLKEKEHRMLAEFHATLVPKQGRDSVARLVNSIVANSNPSSR